MATLDVSGAPSEEMPMTRAEFEALPSTVRALIYQAVMVARRPSEEVSRREAAVAAGEAELRRSVEAARAEQARLARALGESLPDLERKAAVDLRAVDTVSDEGQRIIAESVAAKAALNAIKPAVERLTAADRERESAEALRSVQAFMAERPEFKDPEFRTQVRDRMVSGLSLEDAFALVKGRQILGRKEKEVAPKVAKTAEQQAAEIDLDNITGQQLAELPPDTVRALRKRLGM